jgi:hypothetical protein
MVETVYISGKISGLDPAAVRDKFGNAADLLTLMGYDPVSPLHVIPEWESESWTSHMVADLKAMMRCDAIFFLPDWKESLGGRIEHKLAIFASKTMFYSIADAMAKAEVQPPPSYARQKIFLKLEKLRFDSSELTLEQQEMFLENLMEGLIASHNYVFLNEGAMGCRERFPNAGADYAMLSAIRQTVRGAIDHGALDCPVMKSNFSI